MIKMQFRRACLTIACCFVFTSGIPAAEAQQTLTDGEVAFVLGAKRHLTGCFVYPPNADASASIGEIAFFDRGLSRKRDVACADCHNPQHAWGDGKSVAEFGSALSKRNSPSLLNVADQRWFFWNGRAPTLHDQAVEPLTSPTEMANDEKAIQQYLKSREPYRSALAARQDMTSADTLRWLAEEIAAFEKTLVSCGSRFDAFAAVVAKKGKPEDAFSATELRGLRLFVGKGACTLCHFGPRLSDGEFHNVRVAPADNELDVDLGRYGVVAQLRGKRPEFSRLLLSPSLLGAFKTPSLRNVAITGPYMHAGQYSTLRQVIDHYSEFSNATPLDHHQDVVLWPREFTNDEKADLEEFLMTLTDTEGPCIGKHHSGDLPCAIK